MNWFKKHLNWSFAGGLIIWLLLSTILGILKVNSFVLDLLLLAVLLLTLWFLKQKRQPLWWALLIIVPLLGLLLIFCLPNGNDAVVIPSNKTAFFVTAYIISFLLFAFSGYTLIRWGHWESDNFGFVIMFAFGLIYLISSTYRVFPFDKK